MPEPEDVTTPPEPAEVPVPLTRRERRAQARGGAPAEKVAGAAGARFRPPPSRKRNYAVRKSG